MSHEIKTTEALVLAAREAGDGTQILTLLTADLGLIFARAQGLRELKSKLRYGLQLFDLANVSLVRGQETWRVTNSEPRHSLAPEDPVKLVLITRVAGLLNRLVRGEEKHPELFDEYKNGLVFISQTVLDSSQIRVYELILVLRLLHRLGYIEKRQELSPLLDFADWSESDLDQSRSVQGLIVEMINQALHHSHL
jgi:DNA repair protein RecO